MITHVANDLLNSAAATSAAPCVTHRKKAMSVLTNAGLDDKAREKLLDEGFVIQVMDDASLLNPPTAYVEADIVVIDRSLLGRTSLKAMAQLRFLGNNAPVVFVDDIASLMKLANHSSEVACRSHGMDTVASELKPAATSTASGSVAPADKQLVCGRVVLQPNGSRVFWSGEDVELTFGEYRIVDLLTSKPGQYFTYRAIYDRLRHEGFIANGGPAGHCANVRSAIKRIRNKFRGLDPTFDAIKNYQAFGYAWRKHT
jgi:two-component system, OmpR family, response regulator ChvI